MLRWTLIFVAAVLALPAAGQNPSESTQTKRIAITFDDAPRSAGALYTSDERALRLIAAMAEAGVKQAAFFINPRSLGRRPEGERHITAYVAAGHVIANHTHSHPRLRDTETAEYIASIDAAGRWLDRREGYRPWFRFPYLDEGADDKPKRDAIRAALAQRGLRNGYVTVDASDWFYDGALTRAMRDGAEVDLDALAELFIESHVEAARVYDNLARASLGRSPAHVLLLHETDLVALTLTDLIAALRADGWTIITADEAYADPIGGAMPDVPFSQGTLVEMIAWEHGVPAPRWYERNNTNVAGALFRERVLGLPAEEN